MWQKRDYNKNREQDSIKQGIPRLLARLLAQRDIHPDNYDDFLTNRYGAMSHPHSIDGIKEAADIFIKIAQCKGNVAVIGDYDADGIISSTMIKELCLLVGIQCQVFLPSRTSHGYGLNPKTLKAFKETMEGLNYKPDLLIVVDCGSNNEQDVIRLKNEGISKVIIIDHHLVDPDKMSKSADVLINWHLSDHDEMCACGEVYQFIRAISILTKKVNPIEFLSYAAIGTVGDISPLKGDNRIIVKNGLSKSALDNVLGHGLISLITESRVDLDTLRQSDVSFKIIPRINAAGRMAEPDMAYKLLVGAEKRTTDILAKQLTEYNEGRKKIQKEIQIEAIKEVSLNPSRYKYGILLYRPEWFGGVLGIVASKLSETFKKPTLIAGLNGDDIKGSGRCDTNYNLKDILDDCHDVFHQYGGHAMAAGITLKKESLAVANDKFNEACNRYIEKHSLVNSVSYYDVELKPSSVTMDTAKLLLNNMYPYCQQFNWEPICLLSNVVMEGVELFEPKGWKILVFHVSKDKVKIPLQMKIFTNEFGTEMEGIKVDIYFRFPQTYVVDQYGKYQLDVVEIIKK